MGPTHHERMEQIRLDKERQLVAQRRGAQRRAAALALQQRLQREEKAEEAKSAAALRDSLMQATLRREARAGSADFQEEEARRANRASNMAHQAFTQTFLAGDGWTVADLQRAQAAQHRGGDRDDSDVLWGKASAPPALLAESADGLVVPPHAVSPLLQCTFPLQHRAVLRAEASQQGPLPDDGLDATLSDYSDEEE
jgi:hypothetical protein